MRRGLCLLCAALIILCSVAVPAMAVQMDGTVHVSGNTYYDSREKMFLYYVNTTSSQAVRSNAADGMITDQPVTVKADAGVALGIYLDGVLQQGVYNGTFHTPGEYVVMHLDGSVSQRIFSFTVVPEVCNYVTSYALPSGFEMTDATLNDVAVGFDKNYIKLDAEGQYLIYYRCVKTNVPYELKIRTDHTGPVLALKDVVNGKASGPVDISDARNAAIVNIYHEGEKIARKDVLTESGEYHIELIDEAGNKTTYTFTILIYFDGNSWLVILIILGSIAAVVVYLLHSRKHLRVR